MLTLQSHLSNSHFSTPVELVYIVSKTTLPSAFLNLCGDPLEAVV